MKILDLNGVSILWQRIKTIFARKNETVSNISRNNTTFTATRADGTTFTFDQKDTTYNNATTSTAGLMSAADKVKLNSIENGAQENVVESVSVNGTKQAVTNKGINITVPTAVSSLNNDLGYLTEESDPTVPSWAKQAQKPVYTASEVGALSADTKVPTKTSELTNDSGFITNSDIATPDWNAASDESGYIDNKPNIRQGTDTNHTAVAENSGTTASGANSHAEGFGTKASSTYQHVQGKYNIEDTEDIYAHIVGNGDSKTRSNAHTLDWDGNAWFAGKVAVGSDPSQDMDLVTKRYVDVNTQADKRRSLINTLFVDAKNLGNKVRVFLMQATNENQQPLIIISEPTYNSTEEKEIIPFLFSFPKYATNVTLKRMWSTDQDFDSELTLETAPNIKEKKYDKPEYGRYTWTKNSVNTTTPYLIYRFALSYTDTDGNNQLLYSEQFKSVLSNGQLIVTQKILDMPTTGPMYIYGARVKERVTNTYKMLLGDLSSGFLALYYDFDYEEENFATFKLLVCGYGADDFEESNILKYAIFPAQPDATNSIADTYSNSSTYAIGDIVVQNGKLYKCITAISTAESWTAAHWEEITVKDYVDDNKGTVVTNVSGATPVITAEADTRYICGEVTSLSFTPCASGICDVRFTSGSTVTVLTLPNTVKMPDWFDATSLKTNTIYEINILDGVYGVVTTWAV